MFNLSYVNEFSFLTCTFKSVKIKGVYENENNKSLLAEQVQEMFLTEKKNWRNYNNLFKLYMVLNKD